MHIAEFRARLQPHLDAFIQSKTASYACYTGDPFLLSLFNYPGHMAHGTGKRIRPYVAYLIHTSLREGSREDEEQVIALLVSLELFHLFCLVHDDIIDRGTQRYGLPTIQRFVAGEMGQRKRLSQHEHIGEAHAMLTGDLLFAWSQEVLNRNTTFGEAELRAARRYYYLMIDELVIGQMIDVDMMTRRDTALSTITQKMVLKTASYTFIRPMQMGAALAGKSAEHEQFCYELGYSLGVAFQLQDDLLDIVGTPQQTRKTQFSDLREGQHTYFTQYIFEYGTPAQREELRNLLGTNLGPEDRARVLELFDSSGAIAHGQEQVEKHLREASRLIQSGPLCAAARDGFCDLISFMRARQQ